VGAGTLTRARVAGAAMIVAASAAIQLAAAAARSLFTTLGPAGVSSLRFALATAIILPLVRPRLRGRDAATWLAVAAYGVSLAVLNLTFFEAVARLQLGLAVTFAFLAPLAVALAGSRRRRDAASALVAAGGVAVLGGLGRPGSAVGVAFAIAAGAAWAGVAFAGRSVGRRTRRVDGLALAIPVACVVTLPFGAGRVGALTGRGLVLGAAIAVGGLILPFALELEALRRLEPRLVAVIYSCDPAIAAVVGLIVLGQGLRPAQVAGIAAVVCASAAATASANRRADAGEYRPTPAKGRSMSTQNEQLARRFFDELCNGRRLDVAAEIMTADHVYHDPQSPPSEPGPEGMADTVRVYQDTLAGHWQVNEIIATDDRVVTRWTGTGVHQTDLMGVPATGRRVSVEAISVMRVQDGKIAEHWCAWDTLGLLQQIGAVPAPAAV